MICTTNHHISFGFFSFSTRLKQKLVLRPKPNLSLFSKPSPKPTPKRINPQVHGCEHFKSSGLLCWRSDLVFSNLRVHFLNTLKALHLCWAAVRNHKVVAFVGFNQDLLSQAWHTLMCDLFKSRSLKRDIYPSVNRAFWWSKSRAQGIVPPMASLGHKAKPQAKVSLPLRNVVKHACQPYALLNQLSRLVNQPTWKTSGLTTPGLSQKPLLKQTQARLAYEQLQGKMDFSTSRLGTQMYKNNLTGFFSNPDLSFKTNLNHYKFYHTGLLAPGRKPVKANVNADLAKIKAPPKFDRRKRTAKSGLNIKGLGLSLAKSGFKQTQAQRVSKAHSGFGPYGFSAHAVNVSLSPVTNYEAQAYKHLNSKLKLKTFKTAGSDLFKPRLDLNADNASKNFKTFSMISRFVALSLALRLAQPPAALASSLAHFNTKVSRLAPRAPKYHTLYDTPQVTTNAWCGLKTLHQNLPLFYLKANPPMAYPKKPHQGLGRHGNVTQSKTWKLNPNRVNLKSGEPNLNYYDQGVLKNLGAEFKDFVTNPNLKQADLIFFSNPNKTPALAKQARYLNIPTLGLMSGLRSNQNSCGAQKASIVSFGMLGNPENGWLSFNTVCTFLNVSLKASTRRNTNFNI